MQIKSIKNYHLYSKYQYVYHKQNCKDWKKERLTLYNIQGIRDVFLIYSLLF